MRSLPQHQISSKPTVISPYNPSTQSRTDAGRLVTNLPTRPQSSTPAAGTPLRGSFSQCTANNSKKTLNRPSSIICSARTTCPHTPKVTTSTSSTTSKASQSTHSVGEVLTPKLSKRRSVLYPERKDYYINLSLELRVENARLQQELEQERHESQQFAKESKDEETKIHQKLAQISQLAKDNHDELLWTRANRDIYIRAQDQAIQDLDDVLQGKEALVLKWHIALNRDMRLEKSEWKHEVDKLRNQLDEKYKVRRGSKVQTQESRLVVAGAKVSKPMVSLPVRSGLEAGIKGLQFVKEGDDGDGDCNDRAEQGDELFASLLAETKGPNTYGM